MYIAKENQRLYPATWEYNASRILTELAKIVENHGGRVKPQRCAIISNRTLSSAIREYTDKIAHLTELEKNESKEIRKTAIKTYQDKLDQLLQVNNEPIKVTHTVYIHFVYDGYMYSYSFNDNPFFEFFYRKTPINGNEYCTQTYSHEDKKEWLYDCFFQCNCSDADIVEAANLIFNMLVSSKPSQIYKDTKRQRVPNTYDGGWHYEEVPIPVRKAKIDF